VCIGSNTYFILTNRCRWHEHDADELQKVAEDVIEGAVAQLEKEVGFSKESIKVIGITNQRETTVAWSRKSGKPLCKAIVWDDGRTAGVVAHYEKKLQEEGIQVDGKSHKGQDGKKMLAKLYVHHAFVDEYQPSFSCGLPLSTYFSAIKLHWMMIHHEAVKKAHDEDDLLMGTVESWIVYVRLMTYTLGPD
jgi:glycerol kinase